MRCLEAAGRRRLNPSPLPSAALAVLLSALALGHGTGCARRLTHAELLDVHAEVFEQNHARFEAARAELVAKGYVLGEDHATHHLGPGEAVGRELLRRCLDARRDHDPAPLPLRLYERVETRHLPREEVTAPAWQACAFLEGSYGSLTLTLPDGGTRHVERLDEERWLTATSPSGEQLLLQPHSTPTRTRTVRVSCEHDEPGPSPRRRSQEELVPFRFREDTPPKPLRLAYDVEHVEEVCD